MRVPISSAAATPMTRPSAPPSSVCPTAAHREAPRASSQSAVAVWDIDGNSSARITPAALSPCQRPSAAASTAIRSPYLRPVLRTFGRARFGTLGVPDQRRGRGSAGNDPELLHVALDLRDGVGV